MTDKPVLSCTHLQKSYQKGTPVLCDLSLSIPAGKIVGLLGPNGCGKTTFLKMAAGILVPDGGDLQICGRPRTEASNADISYLPERTYFNSWMRVDEIIRYFCEFFPDFDEACARRMLNDLNIDCREKLKHLSKGTKEKVQLILVMSRKTRLYLLDEPIAGVDPAARDYILRTIIGSYNPKATVLITTHLIYDIESVLDEFYFMGYGGQILLSGKADAVRAERGKTLDQLFREVFRCSANY